MTNKPAFLTSSTVRQWVASLEVEEFLNSASKKPSSRKSRTGLATTGNHSDSQEPRLLQRTSLKSARG